MAASSPSVIMLTADRQIDRRILQSAQSLRNCGWQVTIVAMPADTICPFEDGQHIVRVGNNEQTVVPRRESLVLAVYRIVRAILPMNGRLMRALKRLAWSVFVDQENFYQRLYGPTVQRFKPTVFMAHDLPMLPVARRAAEASGAKLVYDSHELYAEQEFSSAERRKWREIEDKHIRACNAVITVNPSIARELEARYRLAQPVHVLYNAAYLEAPQTARRTLHDALALPDGARILLMQGGLSAGRNIETLVRAMAKIRTPDVHLVLLGDGQLERRLQRVVRDLGLEQRVHFHAAVPQARLPVYTASAHAGAIPYLANCLNNRYCTPNKLFEYIAAELPVLASDLPEISRVVHTYDLGLTADFSTEAAVAAGIDTFFSDSGRIQRWRQNAAAARSQLCWEQEEKKLVSIFEAFR